jgi:hypothetical protein
VCIFISPRNRVAQLYPRALGCLFVASYDSQGYDEGILIRIYSVILRVFVVAGMSLPSCCLATKVGPYLSKLLPNNDKRDTHANICTKPDLGSGLIMKVSGVQKLVAGIRRHRQHKVRISIL